MDHDADRQQQERTDFESTLGRTDPDHAEQASGAASSDSQRDHGDAGDARVQQPGEENPDERALSLGDVGETPRGQGQDRMGGYGGIPVPQEPGPDQDEGLHN